MDKLDIYKFVEQEHYKDGQYTYALLYYYDRLVFEPISQLKSLSLDYLVQGWFFGPKAQVHVFEGPSGLLATQTAESDLNKKLLKKEEQLLDPRFKHIGKALQVNKYWVEDEDGQVFVSHQELTGVVGWTI